MRKPNEKHPEPPLTFGAPRHLANVTVILVGPAVPGNIGSAARAMTTMGLTDLVVLNGPKDFRTHLQTISWVMAPAICWQSPRGVHVGGSDGRFALACGHDTPQTPSAIPQMSKPGKPRKRSSS